MFRRRTITIFSVLLLAFGGGLSIFNVLHAEDDEREVNDEYQKVAPKTVAPKTVTQEVVVTPARTVVENQIRTIYLPDRDHDGIADYKDLHPDFADIYIVKDDNLNGIVDTFEYGK